MTRILTLGLHRTEDDFVVVPVSEGDEGRLEFVFPSEDLVGDYMRIAGASQRTRTLELVGDESAAMAVAAARIDDSRDAVVFEVGCALYAVATIDGDGHYSGHALPVITDLRPGAEPVIFTNAGEALPADTGRIVIVRKVAGCGS